MKPTPQPGAQGREIIFEFNQVGQSVRVTAMDTETLDEVVVIGAPSAGEAALRRAALDKLRYVQSRKGGA